MKTVAIDALWAGASTKAPIEDRRLRELSTQLDRLTAERPARLAEADRDWDTYQTRLEEAGGRQAPVKMRRELTELEERASASQRRLDALDAEIEQLTQQRDVMEEGIRAEKATTDVEGLRADIREIDQLQTKLADVVRRAIARSARLDMLIPPAAKASTILGGLTIDALHVINGIRDLADPPEHGGRWHAWKHRAAAAGLLDAPPRKPRVEGRSTAELQQAAQTARNVASAAIVRRAE